MLQLSQFLFAATAIMATIVVWLLLTTAHAHNRMSLTWNALAYVVRAFRRLSSWAGHVSLAINAGLELYHFDHQPEEVKNFLPCELRLPRQRVARPGAVVKAAEAE
jgi:hypothetical protein